MARKRSPRGPDWRGTGNRLPKAAKSKLDEHRGLDPIRDWLARLPFDYGQQRRRDDETPPEEVMPPGPEVPPA